ELDPIANRYNTDRGQKIKFAAKVGNTLGNLVYAGSLAGLGSIGEIAISKGLGALKDRLDEDDEHSKKSILQKILGTKGNS
ncbi:hypothetical protein, partial [Thermosynechococcus sp.]|uniref:hypothetical protein n=1 Tax=Thermosynechococcus sp. TaxID=2814275 RepID=UPI00391CE1D2